MQAKNFEERLRAHAASFHPVVPFEKSDRLLAMDFTAANTALTTDVLADTALFTAHINESLQAAGARYGIGGYDEHRTIYSRSAVFDGDEPRRLHLGTDIWGAPGTEVMAPLDGTVHSFAYNDAFGDYGATIILEHHLGGQRFHTLYGHLSLASIKGVEEGEAMRKGTVVGAFGSSAENGHWPPHLHFQVVLSMDGWKGDYPGVCRYSERGAYLSNSPDPDLILRMNHWLREGSTMLHPSG